MDRFAGFSKLTVSGKLGKLADEGFINPETRDLLISFQPEDLHFAALLENMTENVVSAYSLPYSIAPGFLINGKEYVLPMVTEESSVVAAASWSAKFWAGRGGFQTRIISETKTGQIHFLWTGDPAKLTGGSSDLFATLRSAAAQITAGMESRGGGITGFELIDLTKQIDNLFQIRVLFRTADSMGANFINSCLEKMSSALCGAFQSLFGAGDEPEVIMSILSNHIPECRVECTVECPIDDLAGITGIRSPSDFARRFALAVNIARIDPYRAVTHNKGIYNGIDAVVLATANDFRAVEASGHAWASISGRYTGLTRITTDHNIFRYTLEVPMALGTVGGLTKTHPLAAASLKILGDPGAAELMQIASAAGMASNFAALKALVTTGIQAGHMPLHHRKSTPSLNTDTD